MRLDGPRHPPATGAAPARIVLLLHGYGADGDDLIGLAPAWAPAMPDALFVSPHAPFPCEGAPFGRQWFGLHGRGDALRLARALAYAAQIRRDSGSEIRVHPLWLPPLPRLLSAEALWKARQAALPAFEALFRSVI